MSPTPYIYAFICTRGDKISKTTDRLLVYLRKAGVEVHLLVDKKSIFDAYSEELKFIQEEKAKKDDIVIMCHDDIEILNDPEEFIFMLKQSLNETKVGIVGAAGTTHLTKSAVWWDEQVWRQNGHRGTVFHGKDKWEMNATTYGVAGDVVVCDGLFLASTVGVLSDIGLEKPKTFNGEWDFYDLTYCMRAYEEGYINKVAPILLRHESAGELVGRDSWHENRKKFISMTRLPVKC